MQNATDQFFQGTQPVLDETKEEVKAAAEAAPDEPIAAEPVKAAPLLIREAALKIALGYEGETEVPLKSNWGPFVKACLATVNLTAPAAWCMAFIFRCFKEGADKLQIKNPLFCTASALSCWRNTPPGKRLLKADARPTNVLPGYIAIFDHGEGKGHVCMVVEAHADGSYTTIEGNTNNDGSRDGVGVFKRKRNLNDKLLVGFITH